MLDHLTYRHNITTEEYKMMITHLVGICENQTDMQYQYYVTQSLYKIVKESHELTNTLTYGIISKLIRFSLQRITSNELIKSCIQLITMLVTTGNVNKKIIVENEYMQLVTFIVTLKASKLYEEAIWSMCEITKSLAITMGTSINEFILSLMCSGKAILARHALNVIYNLILSTKRESYNFILENSALILILEMTINVDRNISLTAIKIISSVANDTTYLYEIFKLNSINHISISISIYYNDSEILQEGYKLLSKLATIEEGAVLLMKLGIVSTIFNSIQNMTNSIAMECYCLLCNLVVSVSNSNYLIEILINEGLIRIIIVGIARYDSNEAILSRVHNVIRIISKQNKIILCPSDMQLLNVLTSHHSNEALYIAQCLNYE